MIRFIAATAGLMALLYLAAFGVGPAPPLGPLLDPVDGIWSVARGADLPESATGVVPSLEATTRVVYDDRGVPHVFARSRLDAVRALGYVVARDRLFQLELQVRATEGTLTELAGPVALSADRAQRRMGLASSAEDAWASLAEDAPVRRELEAYADGVNAWIEDMRPRDLPFEYHLLGARPRAWLPQYGLYVHRGLGANLSWGDDAVLRADVAARVGREAAGALVPLRDPFVEPMVPTGETYPRRDPLHIPPPGSPVPLELTVVDGGAPSTAQGALAPAGTDRSVGIGRWPGRLPGVLSWLAARGHAATDGSDPMEAAYGSNAWAAGPSKTASGATLLAGDPHLGYALPGLPYEVHLVVPGELDVAGATFPGLPSVVLGYNRDVAWSFTNARTDPLDLYKETLDDPDAPTRYLLDGDWRPLEHRVETYRGPSGEVLLVDTIYVTHRGPVLEELRASGSAEYGTHYSARWTIHEDRGESVAALIAMQSATSVEGWLDAFAPYTGPIQNAVVADRHGSIAARSGGRYPIRPGDGRGDRLFDGRTSANDWVGDLPLARQPIVVDPEQGFVATANQRPVDPRATDTYLGVGWVDPWRAVRINELLRASDELTMDDFERFQFDAQDSGSEILVAAFLAAAEGAATSGSPDLRRAAELLGEWNGSYAGDNRRTVLFDLARTRLNELTWDELDFDLDGGVTRAATPRSTVLAMLLDQPESPWWDLAETPGTVETRDDILNRSLVEALETARERHGDEGGDGWLWENVHRTDIGHPLGLPALGALDLPGRGGPYAVNAAASGGAAGPVWRMVVELDDQVHARTIQAGGQSGHPLSHRYRDRIEPWLAGELQPTRFPHDEADLEGKVSAELTLQGAAP